MMSWFGKRRKSGQQKQGAEPPSVRQPDSLKPDNLKPSAKERVIRVFVSSTFRDMVEDRNELMFHVWPALRKVCRKRAVEFVEVDLRWGIARDRADCKPDLRRTSL